MSMIQPLNIVAEFRHMMSQVNDCMSLTEELVDMYSDGVIDKETYRDLLEEIEEKLLSQ